MMLEDALKSAGFTAAEEFGMRSLAAKRLHKDNVGMWQWLEELVLAERADDPKSYYGALVRKKYEAEPITAQMPQFHDLPPHYRYVMRKGSKLLFRANGEDRWIDG